MRGMLQSGEVCQWYDAEWGPAFSLTGAPLQHQR